DYGTQLLKDIDGLRIIGNAADKAAILSIYLESAHPHDIITMLDQDGIALRGGHHCAQPTMIRFGVPATARASMAFYNKFEELDALAESLRKIVKFFA
ncbi:MAG: aminotransferase class V-fold PLP-dependent enzyme, partial [Nitrospinae bacterium]|nr:aminotransferase class V-fold PLP-dependent enzyme [Nitrospinota bacterium]